MKRLLIASGCLAILCHPVAAQEEAAEVKREVKGRKAWFVCTSMPEGIENPVTITSGKEVSQMILSSSSPSLPLKIAADGMARIVRKTDDPNRPGTPVFLTLGEAKVPEAVEKALVILFPREKQDNGQIFRSKVLDLASFKGGDTLYLNLTSARIGVELDKIKMEVRPGSSWIYHSPPLKEPVSVSLRFSHFEPTEQKWKRLASSKIAVYPTQREICIFSWSNRLERIDFDSITFPVE